MAAPSTVDEFLGVLHNSQLVDDSSLGACLARCNGPTRPETANDLADLLVRENLLTSYQAVQLLQGKWERFNIGPFRVLERLGSGAVSNVYLCERPVTRSRVAIKVLAKLGADPTMVPRFYREARAAGLLVHPNIVRAHDVDQDVERKEHFMVMDFVDGSTIQDIVQRFGPMDINRSAHYAKQVAQGLQFAHEKGLVHRDIKPGNLMVDRQGQVRILDMGLARFEEEGGALTQGVVLGAPEYLAPEQAIDSHNVDTRADVYSLGGTLYFMLTGQAPYAEEKSLARKLLAKQDRPPQPIDQLRPDVPAELIAVVERMMASDKQQRYPNPGAVVQALGPWTKTPIPPPSEAEMPPVRSTAPNPAAPQPAASAAAAKAPAAAAPAAKPPSAAAPAAKPPSAPAPAAKGSVAPAPAAKAPPASAVKTPPSPPAPTAPADEETADEETDSAPEEAPKGKKHRRKKRSKPSGERRLSVLWTSVLVAAFLIAAIVVFVVGRGGFK
jgi:serine/threonine protein kinase